jgi:hypothetical protein
MREICVGYQWSLAKMLPLWRSPTTFHGCFAHVTPTNHWQKICCANHVRFVRNSLVIVRRLCVIFRGTFMSHTTPYSPCLGPLRWSAWFVSDLSVIFPQFFAQFISDFSSRKSVIMVSFLNGHACTNKFYAWFTRLRASWAVWLGL